MVATAEFDESHVAEDVTSGVVESVKVAIAVYCCVLPFAIDALGGHRESETGSAGVTVSRAVAVFPEWFAEIIVDPCASDEATPAEIVATPAFDEPQSADDVRSWVVESVKVPVAVNDCGQPFGIEGFAGVIDNEVTIASVTVSRAEEDFPERSAVIVVDPGAIDEARPGAMIVAAPVSDEVHEAAIVTSRILESVKVPVATNCFVRPFGTVSVAGANESEVSSAFVTVSWAEEDFPERSAVIVVVPGATAFAMPVVGSIVATDGVSEVQTAEAVTLDDVPFE